MTWPWIETTTYQVWGQTLYQEADKDDVLLSLVGVIEYHLLFWITFIWFTDQLFIKHPHSGTIQTSYWLNSLRKLEIMLITVCSTFGMSHTSALLVWPTYPPSCTVLRWDLTYCFFNDKVWQTEQLQNWPHGAETKAKSAIRLNLFATFSHEYITTENDQGLVQKEFVTIQSD